jgi:hypothetical protein
MQLTTYYADKLFAHYSEVIRRDFPEWDAVIDELHRLEYFAAPASSRHHLSVKGGLFLHSVGVCERAMKLRAGIPGIPVWHIYLAGLLHDVGKCGMFYDGFLHKRYISDGEGGYSVTGTPLPFTTRDLSALNAARWDCPGDVIQAVLTHDGLYCDQNEPYINNQCLLSRLLANADDLQAKVFETEKEAFSSLPEHREAGQGGPGQGRAGLFGAGKVDSGLS